VHAGGEETSSLVFLVKRGDSSPAGETASAVESGGCFLEKNDVIFWLGLTSALRFVIANERQLAEECRGSLP
jgi:hypothetical protein